MRRLEVNPRLAFLSALSSPHLASGWLSVALAFLIHDILELHLDYTYSFAI
jgi:hypothetical protein